MASVIHGLLTPEESVLALIDYQPQMSFGIQSHSRLFTLNNAVALAKTAKLFQVPVVLTTVAAKSFSGDMLPELQSVYPDQSPIDRTSMNSWEDDNFRNAIKKTGRKKLIIAGWWTEVCACFPTIQALQEGYEVYVPTDACGDISIEAHERAVQRMIQAGAVPMTSFQVMYEFQRDWGRSATYEGCMDIQKAHSDYGIGIRYAKAILGEHASEGGH
ncbi:MAG TPA: hydrolase [Candidatus Limnocylindrales bacterium]|nr:hydrolase [Candidatus Limnocylindrales bacterium]